MSWNCKKIIKENVKTDWKSILVRYNNYVVIDEGIEKAIVEEKYVIYPPRELVFEAFNRFDFGETKVVILGQDPYIRKDEAVGLAFCFGGDKMPPSLKNIYKEIERDIGKEGNIDGWADQGVLLLNTALTVKKGCSGTHLGLWKDFSNVVIDYISRKLDGVVFILWGKKAQEKEYLIDDSKHYILKAAHPSPMAGNAFSGCGHFSKCNKILRKMGKDEIEW